MGCGSGTVCWRRLEAWQKAGVWQRIHETLLAEMRRRDLLDMSRALTPRRSMRACRHKNAEASLPGFLR
jgi:transposase